MNASGTAHETSTGDRAAPQKPLSLVVLGGGTAGWITACWLIQQFGQGAAAQVTLVESKSVGILGVGEATLPTLIPFLRMLGISETEFMKATKATFKRGILYKGWADPPSAEQRSDTYFHPFASTEVATFNSGDWWISARGGTPGAAYADDLSAQGALAHANRAPRGAGGREYDGDAAYAYHMDAELFAGFLAEWCKSRGIRHIEADVTSAEVDADGYVTALRAEQDSRIPGDFFFDCSGFRGLLINRVKRNGFVDYGKNLFCDQAVALRLPHAPDHALRPYTTTTAWDAGWLWEIDLQGRSGLGYVHSSRHTDFDEAEAALRRYAGPGTEELPVRRLKMRVGHSERLWDKNVIAVGLSGGFIEPLESTGIFLVEAGARHAAKSLSGILGGLLDLKTADAASLLEGRFSRESLFDMIESVSGDYNVRMIALFSEIRDFVKAHFCLTRRTDTDFWKANTDESSWSSGLREKLAKWRHRCPDAVDFDSRSALFKEANWLYVMLGMGWRPRAAASTSFHSDAIGAALMRRANEEKQVGLRSLPTMGAFLNELAS